MGNLPFTVTPMGGPEDEEGETTDDSFLSFEDLMNTEELSQEDIEKYKQQAMSEGYLEEEIEEAIYLATADNCQSYEDFKFLLPEPEEAEKQAQPKKPEEASTIDEEIRQEIVKLCKIDDIAQYADTKIYHTYGTHSVSIMDILGKASQEQLNLEVYQEPIYSVLIQLESDWVKDIVNSIMNSWSSKEYPKQFVENYLRSTGVKEEDFDKEKKRLLTFLSVEYKEDTAPDEYKQFKAVQQLLNQRDSNTSDLISGKEEAHEYGATLEVDMEDGVPAQAATADATEAVNNMSMSEKAGALCGKVIGLKYKTAKSFEDMMYENMGEYAEDYKKNKEAVDARKAEIKEQRANKKLEKEKTNREYKLAREKQKAEQPKVRNSYENEYVRGRGVERTRSRNLGPAHIPPVLIVSLINVFLVLLSLLLFDGFGMFIAIAGLVVATVGFFKVQSKEQYGYLITLGGYALFILSILI